MKLKYINLALLAFMIHVYAFSQPVLGPQKTFGGSDYDEIRKLCLTKDGGYVVAGLSYSNASGEKTENSRGGQDYWVLKLSRTGKIEWQKTIGGNGDDYCKSIIQTTDGGYAVVGDSRSDISGEKTDYCRGSSDIWLVKLDSVGNIQWDKTYGGSGTEFIDNIVQDKDGNYILAASSDSYISGEKSEDSRGSWDMWVVKADVNGNKLWDKTIGGNDYDFCSPIGITQDGGLILVGFSGSNASGEKSQNCRGQSDYWVVKLNKNGNIQWDKTIGGSGDDYCRGLVQAKDGYLLCGNSNSGISGEKTANSWGGYDFWVVKLDKKGNVKWDKTIGGLYDDDEVWSLDSTLDGQGYIFGGYSNSPISGNKTEYSRGGFDYWIVKINKNGKVLWNKTIGGSDDEYLRSNIVEIEKNKFLTGGTSYSGISGDKASSSRGNADYWIVQLNDRTPTSLIIASSQNVDAAGIAATGFKVYPNPVRDNLHVMVNNEAMLTLTNESGKIMLTKKVDKSDIINVAALPPGIYYLKNNTTNEFQKIAVIK